MAPSDEAARLRLGSLAAFHTLSFVVLVALLVYQGGGLGRLLTSLNTASGFGYLGVLWTTTWFATRWGLNRIKEPLDEADAGTIVVAMGGAGALNGVAILIVALVLVTATVAFENPVNLASVLIYGVVAAIPAAALGGVIGFAYGLIDVVVLRLVNVLS